MLNARERVRIYLLYIRKGLFNMTENKHGFAPKQEITIGGIHNHSDRRKLGEVHCFGVYRKRRF